MKMIVKKISLFLVLLFAFTTIFPLSVSKAEIDEKMKAELKKMQTSNPFELEVSDLLLKLGDSVTEYLTYLLKEEVTVHKIIFNRVRRLNANFFDNSTNPAEAEGTSYIKAMVNSWYKFLGKVTLLIYMTALVGVGIKIMLGTASQKASAMDNAKKWTLGIAMFYLFPYLMRYASDLNETIIRLIEAEFSGTGYATMDSAVGYVSDLTKDELEPRSPKYISNSSYLISLGSDEANEMYLDKYKSYKTKGDIMRMMRAYAGITGRLFYIILWYIFLYQTLLFTFIYFKRYLMIAFLITIFPIVLIEYIIGNVAANKAAALGSWCKEFFTNVFLQSIHAIVYGIISGVIIDQIMSSLRTGNESNVNWFLMIIAINFVFTGEKIFREIINAMGTATITDLDEAKSKAKELRKKTIGKAKAIKGKVDNFARGGRR